MANYNRKYPIQISFCLKCGNEFKVTDHPERKRKYCSKECRKHSKIGENNPNYKGKCAAKGERHQFWKGDSVGIDALHTYIRKRLLKPELCVCCKKEPPYDLANISQEYKRDITDWEWLCRKCHMVKDGRLKNLNQFKKGENRQMKKGLQSFTLTWKN